MDADTLLSTPAEKTAFIVDGPIPTGVTLLGGSSKIGKKLAHALAGPAGGTWGSALGHGQPTRCDVLYLCLEDTMGRIQNRLHRLTNEAPAGLRFATACGKLGNGLEEQILQALRDYPETRLVIIDTLQNASDSRSAAGRTGCTRRTTTTCPLLKVLADSQKIAIVLVHHLRKQQDSSDPFNQLSGSTGITGAADTNMVLQRLRGSNTATLLVNWAGCGRSAAAPAL